MDLQETLERHPIASAWPPAARDLYLAFSARLLRAAPLAITIGKGGLSYYAGGVFVCHVNASPRSKEPDLGFADFRYDSLGGAVDRTALLAAIERDLAPGVRMKINRRWCSLHFPHAASASVADVFAAHLLGAIREPSER